MFARPSFRLCLSCLLLAFCLPGEPARAQGNRSRPAPQPPASFADRSDLLAVEVPVNVAGRDGQPVRGLTAEDFEVFDEGKPQKITGFEVIDLEALQGAAGPGGTPEASEAEKARFDQMESSARRHLLLLFDLSFAKPTSVLKARLAARDFVLQSLHPTDLVGVATISLEQGPRLVLTFTPDRAQLARAIDTLDAQRVFTAEADPLRFVISPLGMTSSGASGADQGELPQLRNPNAETVLREYLAAIAKSAEREEKSFQISRITAMTRSMGDLARALGQVQGRKHVVYFSEGFDSKWLVGRGAGAAETAEDQTLILAGRTDQVDPDNYYGNTGLQGDVNKMLDEFRRADCVIQAVDIGGLRGSADASGGERRSGQEALFYMANETGGELFKDANNLGQQLERVVRRNNVTYLLTFERANVKHDGAYRRLRVKARLPQGARLSHRSGYYAPRPFKDLDPLEKNLLASDGIASAAPRRELELSLLAAPFRATEDLAYVPVIVEIGGKGLLTGMSGDKLGVELYAYVTDEKGEMRDFFTQVVGLDLGNAREAIEKTGLKYYGHLDLPPGRYRVRVLARNAETGRTGVESLALTVPSYKASEPDLLPPLFFDTPGRWLLVRERNEAGRQESVVYPFTVNGEPYVPAALPSLGRGDEARLLLVTYNLGAGDLKIATQVLAADGTTLSGGRLALVERTATGLAGVEKLIATFKPSGLEAGEYTLRVEVANPATGAKDVNFSPFVVTNL